MWLAVQFINNAQRTQHENADVGISDIKFEINNVEISSLDELERVFDQEQIQKNERSVS